MMIKAIAQAIVQEN